MRDPGSFRDPSGFIFKEKKQIFRVVNESYQTNFNHLISSGLYSELVEKKYIVQHEKTEKNISKDQYCVLKVDRIFPITYPFEWSFSQFKDAAILTLEIQKISLKYKMMLKDANPYNIQFKDSKAIFIDTLSFEKINDENYAWVAYKQFCEMFLGPLCLMSFIDPSLCKLLIPNIDGIPLTLVNKLLKLKHKFNPSIFIHIVLPNIINSKVESIPSEIKKKINKKQHLNIIEQLLIFIKNLKALKEKSEWGEYNFETVSEKKDYVLNKENIIEQLLKNKSYNIVWDVGANDGFYSRKISHLTDSHIMALDIDWKCVEKNYVINKKKNIKNITPILFDLSNPTPGVGWMNNERTNLFSRIGKPDLICLFAVMHHILNRNIPFELLLNFLNETKRDVLIEYIPYSDPKCQIIFKSRPDEFYYPSQNDFEKLIIKNFEIKHIEELVQTKRVLYLIKKK